MFLSDFPEASSSWALVNVGAAGFYRVNYDAATWRQLADQLITDHVVVPQASRAQLMDDAFQLAKTGTIRGFIYHQIQH